MVPRPPVSIFQATAGPGRVDVRLTGPGLDERAGRGLALALVEAGRAHGVYRLFLDFGEVETLADGVLGQLLVLDRHLRDAGGWLSLRNLRPRVYRALAAAHLAPVLDALPSPAD